MALQREFIAELYRNWHKYGGNKKRETHKCRNCDRIFEFHHYNDRFCSDRCRYIYRAAKDEKKEWKVKRAVRNYRMGNVQRAPFEDSLEYSLTRVDVEINDFARVEEIDFGIQDILDIIERDGILEGRVPYMGKPQDEEAALISMLERFIDERADPDEVAFFKQYPEARQEIAPKPQGKPRSRRYASDEIAKIRVKFGG